GEADVFLDLFTEGAGAKGREASAKLQIAQDFIADAADELFFERFNVAEDVGVDEGGEAVKFQQDGLEGGGCQQRLVGVFNGVMQGVGGFCFGLVYIPQTVSFVYDDEIPRDAANLVFVLCGELIRDNNDSVALV